MILTFFKCIGELFCGVCLNLGLSEVPLLDSGYEFFLREYHRSDILSFSLHHGRRSVMSVCAIIGDVNFDHLAKKAFCHMFSS